MGSYDKVQFMSWELHTGPEPLGDGATAAHVFRGLPDQAQDTTARLAFAAGAVARAELFSDHQASTLKIFMGPGCLFRGADASVRAGLQAVAERAPYSDWVFVFGAALAGPVAGAPAAVHGVALVQHRDRYLARCRATDGALFQMPGVADRDGHPIDFRVVLDPGQRRAVDAPARIELVPSCGAVPDADRLDLRRRCTNDPASYALHCDGLRNLNGSRGHHTRVWGRVALAGAPRCLVEVSRDGAHVGTELVMVASEVPTALGCVRAGRLWNQEQHQGAGKVRMIAPLTL